METTTATATEQTKLYDLIQRWIAPPENEGVIVFCVREDGGLEEVGTVLRAWGTIFDLNTWTRAIVELCQGHARRMNEGFVNAYYSAWFRLVRLGTGNRRIGEHTFSLTPEANFRAAGDQKTPADSGKALGKALGKEQIAGLTKALDGIAAEPSAPVPRLPTGRHFSLDEIDTLRRGNAALHACVKLIASVNWQDHPIAEQRQARDVLREAMRVINPRKFDVVRQGGTTEERRRAVAKAWIDDVAAAATRRRDGVG